jgi:hypothetical protein
VRLIPLRRIGGPNLLHDFGRLNLVRECAELVEAPKASQASPMASYNEVSVGVAFSMGVISADSHDQEQ